MIEEPNIEWRAACDGCGEQRYSLINWGSDSRFREKLAEEGWTETDNGDFCPACSESAAEPGGEG